MESIGRALLNQLVSSQQLRGRLLAATSNSRGLTCPGPSATQLPTFGNMTNTQPSTTNHNATSLSSPLAATQPSNSLGFAGLASNSQQANLQGALLLKQ
jgi:hypothetical protein